MGLMGPQPQTMVWVGAESREEVCWVQWVIHVGSIMYSVNRIKIGTNI